MKNQPTEADNHEATTIRVLRRLATGALLLIVLAVAAYLWLVGLDWGKSQHFYPDEHFPMTIAYYRTSLNSDLGFDLVGDFTSWPSFDPIQFADNDAEEARTVYNHPRGLIFQKTERSSSEHVAGIRGSVDLGQVVRNVAYYASGLPVTIPLSKLRAAASPTQTAASVSSTVVGSDHNSFWVRFQPITVILWWLLLFLIGWAAFPALYVLMPGLADRGYPLSRMFSLLAAAWVGWMLARSNTVPWSVWSAIVGLAGLAALSAALVFPQRHEFLAWVKARRRHLIWIEIMLAALFLTFVLIRLGNSDLWHPYKGGEKPQDMAYFNAVLKSQTFPPYDPWFSGNTLEYYYFGYVIVGLPLKLIPIPLTLAYNLILPTLFALTGAGAFSVAYNLLAPRREGANQSPPDELTVGDAQKDQPPTVRKALRSWPRISWGDTVAALRGHTRSSIEALDWIPIIGGAAAMLLAAVLGNLDEIRTLLWGLAKLGATSPQWANQALPNLPDVVEGLKLVIGKGQLLPVGLDEWYWNATRLVPIINHGNMAGFEITEFPFFTFLYADLHAHMIAMPITLLALLWCVSNVRGAALDVLKRGGLLVTLLNIVSGALIVGSLRPTNTWDWPTYLVLAVGALALANFYTRKAEGLVPALGVGAIGAGVVGGGVSAFIMSSSPDVNLMTDHTALLSVLGGALVGLLIGFALGQAFTPQRRVSSGGQTDRLSHWLTLLITIVQAGGLAIGTILLYPPYILTYRTGYSSLTPWVGSRTALWAYIDFWGLFLFLIISWMIWETWQWVKAVRQANMHRASLLPIAIAGISCLGTTVLAIAIVATLQNYPVAVLALPITVWAIGLFFRPGQTIEKRAVLAMVALGLVLTSMVDVVVLQGDRMNTIFKFYVQVWILMSVAAGAALGWIWPVIRKARGALRTSWVCALSVLVFLAALYPLLATHAKIVDRWSNDAPHTLDGMAYMPYVERDENGVSFSLKPDYYMLRWLQENITGTPVVLEAHTVEYNWGNRVAVYTGLPAIIGWSWHQRQQHTNQTQEVMERIDDVNTLYETTDVHYTLSMLEQYQVDLIVVGDLERAYYSQAGLDKFKTMAELGYLKVIYSRDNTVIYQTALKQGPGS